jgi:hypothetical protein
MADESMLARWSFCVRGAGAGPEVDRDRSRAACKSLTAREQRAPVGAAWQDGPTTTRLVGEQASCTRPIARPGECLRSLSEFLPVLVRPVASRPYESARLGPSCAEACPTL